MLLNSTADIKEHYGAINVSTSWKTLRTFVAQAENKYLLPVIGPELYEELVAGVAAVEGKASVVTLTGAAQKLYRLLSASLAYYAVLDALPFLNLSIGDAGVQETNLANYQPARQWSFFQTENAAAGTADAFLDQALAFLERNAADFPVWLASEAYTISKELFISNTADLSRYVNIQGSRRAYLALKPFLLRAETLYIAAELGYELYDALKASLLANTITPAEKAILLRVQPALAHLALYEAIPELAISITGGGYKILNENDGIKNRLAAKATDTASLSTKSYNLAQKYLAELRRHLDTITQTGETDPDDNKQTWQPPDNTGSPSFWV